MKVRERTLAAPVRDANRYILDDDAVSEFYDLMQGVVLLTPAAEKDESSRAAFTAALQKFRDFVAAYRGDERRISDLDLARLFASQAGLDLGLLVRGGANNFLKAFQDVANVSNIPLAAPPKPFKFVVAPERKKKNKILPGMFKGRITVADIVASARAERAATGRTPTGKDRTLIKYGRLAYTGLTWHAVQDSVTLRLHGLKSELKKKTTMGEIFRAAGIPKGKVFLTPLDLIWSAWSVYYATGKNLSDAPFAVIKHGSLAGLPKNRNMDKPLEVVRCRLTPRQILKMTGIPQKKKMVLTIEKIVASVRAEHEATGDIVCGNEHRMIAHGPLAGSGLRWFNVRDALKSGRYGLPGGQSFSEALKCGGFDRTKFPRNRVIKLQSKKVTGARSSGKIISCYVSKNNSLSPKIAAPCRNEPKRRAANSQRHSGGRAPACTL